MQVFITGTGSLPYKNVSKAIENVLVHYSEIPFWPQLPSVDMGDGLLGQFLVSLKALNLLDNDNKLTDKVRENGYLLDCFNITSNMQLLGLLPVEYAHGLYELTNRDLSSSKYIKVQITGLITLASYLKDKDGISAYNFSILIRIIANIIKKIGLLQFKLLKKFNKPIMIFLDEPGFIFRNWCLIPDVCSKELLDLEKEIINFFQRIGFEVGLHICADAPWDIIGKLGLNIINPDVWAIKSWDSFWRNISYYDTISWGIVPTKGTEDHNWKNINEMVCFLKQEYAKRMTNKLITRTIITPCCGLAYTSEEMVELIVKKQEEVAKAWFEKYKMEK